MALKLCSLASGSKANCTLISSDTTNILVDLGLSEKALCAKLGELGLKAADISAVVITHSHGDHTAGIWTFGKKHNIPIYAHVSICRVLRKPAKPLKCLVPIDDGDYFVGDITVSPFRVSHDVPCFGISFYCAGRKITVMTDLGVLPDAIIQEVKDSDILMMEANHDEQMLLQNPNYTQSLKQRILSARGHLSNKAGASALLKMLDGGVKQVVLAHLSEQNNDPMTALREFIDTLSACDVIVGKDVLIDVALQNEISKIYVIA